jgi:hypothetical protein
LAQRSARERCRPDCVWAGANSPWRLCRGTAMVYAGCGSRVLHGASGTVSFVSARHHSLAQAFTFQSVLLDQHGGVAEVSQCYGKTTFPNEQDCRDGVHYRSNPTLTLPNTDGRAYVRPCAQFHVVVGFNGYHSKINIKLDRSRFPQIRSAASSQYNSVSLLHVIVNTAARGSSSYRW